MVDPHNLDRFVRAQDGVYDEVIAELNAGRKCTHWMWFIFPQFDGLGFSPMAHYYAVKSIAEARSYLNHPTLGPRLQECMAALLAIEGRSAYEILGSPDDLKLRSCATLFAAISMEGSVFERVLTKYYQGEPDCKTLQLISVQHPSA